MKLVQITDETEVAAILHCHFVFHTVTLATIDVHRIEIDGNEVGYVATENLGPVGGVHICIEPVYKVPYINDLNWLFQNVYKPLQKALGKEYLVTNCDLTDRGTLHFMENLGFEIKKVAVAEMAI